jgi:glycosyltransferase involved in cell wall biosynthesis
VVVSTDGGLRELIRDGENGLLCDPYDLPSWIAATRRLLDDRPFARALSHAGHATVAELTPTRHAARIAEIYRGLPSRMGEAA